MKKRIVYIVVSVLSVVTFFVISVSAGLELFNGRRQPIAELDQYVQKEASEEKTIEGINENPEKVTYQYTQKINDDQSVDIYMDENGVSYEIDAKTGEVVGYYNNTDSEILWPENKMDEISLKDQKEPHIAIDGKATKEQAISIAEAEAKRVYEKEYSKFKFHRADQYVQDDSYLIQLGEFWGENDFALAREIRVHVTSNGEISSCVMFNREAMMGKDESILNGVTKKMVEQDVRKQRAELGEDADNFEILNITIEKHEDIYRLAVLVKNCTHYYYYTLN